MHSAWIALMSQPGNMPRITTRLFRLARSTQSSQGLIGNNVRFYQRCSEAAAMLKKRIVTVHGTQLARLMIRYDIGCRVEETIRLKQVDETISS